MRTSPMVARHIAVAKMEARSNIIRTAVYTLEQRAFELEREIREGRVSVEEHELDAVRELRQQAQVIGAL